MVTSHSHKVPKWGNEPFFHQKYDHWPYPKVGLGYITDGQNIISENECDTWEINTLEELMFIDENCV